MTPDVAPGVMRGLGFRGEPAPTFRAPLYPDDEQRTFRGLKDSARRNVRRAERLGVVGPNGGNESVWGGDHGPVWRGGLRGGEGRAVRPAGLPPGFLPHE